MYQNIYIDRNEDNETIVYLWDDEKGLLEFSFDPYRYAYQVGGSASTWRSLYGSPVRRVTSWAENDATIFEGDVPRETRVLTDIYLDNDTPSKNHVVFLFDIEVDTTDGLPKIDKAENAILSISGYNKATKEYTLWIIDPENKVKDRPNVTIKRFKTERAMLESFLAYYAAMKPTIISGWNSDYFDVPYVYKRLCVVFDEEIANTLSPIGIVTWNPMKSRYRIAGVASLDYLLLYKKFTYTQRPNYRLGTIAEIELGTGKVEYEGDLQELYESDIDHFASYSIRDAEILEQLDQKKKLIELARNICHVGHIGYEDFAFSSRYLEGTILVQLHRKGVVAPNKPMGGAARMEELQASDEDGFVGAYVKEPIPGRYDWVYSLDLQSLYPSIIMTLNISPETKIGKVTNWNATDFMRDKINEFNICDLSGIITKLPKKEFLEFMEDGKFTIAGNGCLYRTDKEGILSEILNKWFNERLEYKKLAKKYKAEGNQTEYEYYDDRQLIQKILLNSLYGVLGLPVFRFYDLDNAEAVTVSGQDIVQMTATMVQKQLSKSFEDAPEFVIYQDTDSCYVTHSHHIALHHQHQDSTFDEDKKACINAAKQMEEFLNKMYIAMAKKAFFTSNCRFVIKGESVADAGFWTTKKRYALHKVYDLDKNSDADEIVVKGMDVVRSSFPKAFTNLMNVIIKEILAGKQKSDVDSLIINFRHKIREFPVQDIARNTSCKDMKKYFVKDASLNEFESGTPVHVKAALVYNRLLKHYKIQNKYEAIEDGAKIKWIYLKDNPLKISQVAFKGYNDPPQIHEMLKSYVDYDKVFESELQNKLEDFYNALKWGNPGVEVNPLASQFFEF